MPTRLDTAETIRLASEHLTSLAGHKFDLLRLSKPVSVAAAVNLAKIVSKLSPLVGNLIEFNTCDVVAQLGGGTKPSGTA